MATVLVTGGAGFVGSHAVRRLLDAGHRVSVWDDLSNGRMENIDSRADFWETMVEFADPQIHCAYDAIVHLAALPRIQPSFEKPSEVQQVNVMGTLTVLEMCRIHGCRLVFASSSSVGYGHDANPYTFSKHIGEEYCNLYNKLYGVNATVIRPSNVYGPGQPETPPQATLIGIFARLHRLGQKLTVTGDGGQRRDFVHVYDVADAIVEAVDAELDGYRVLEVGSGESHSVMDVARMFGGDIEFLPPRPGEARDTLADIRETREVLGWEPCHKLEDYVSGLCSSE